MERLFKSFLARNGRVTSHACDFCGPASLAFHHAIITRARFPKRVLAGVG
jgi:hypothetical protein